MPPGLSLSGRSFVGSATCRTPDWSRQANTFRVPSEGEAFTCIADPQIGHLVCSSGTRDLYLLGFSGRIRKRGCNSGIDTLLLQARQPVHVVSERLGHSKVSLTIEVYADVLHDVQREAAATLSALLHG
jgi:hypothetical protein